MASRTPSTTTFADYDAMLADDNVDAVIAVADQFHVPLSIKALEAGKHVLVEKPMATTVEDASALLDTARTHDRVVLVSHEKRYDPGVAFAHDFIREEIGEPIGLEALVLRLHLPLQHHRHPAADHRVQRRCLPTSPATLADWQRRPHPRPRQPHARHSPVPRRPLGGHPSPTVDEGRHVLAGSSRWSRQRLPRPTRPHDRGPDGLVGRLPGLRQRGQRDRQAVQPVVPPRCRGAGLLGQGRPVPPADRRGCRSGLRLQIEDLVNAALTGATTRGATAEDGLASVRAMVALAKSVTTGDWVKLDDVTGGLV